MSNKQNKLSASSGSHFF